jgi:hypothetical protein
MKTLMGGVCGALLGCVAVGALWFGFQLLLWIGPGDSLGNGIALANAFQYVPRLAIISAAIGCVVGAFRAQGR